MNLGWALQTGTLLSTPLWSGCEIISHRLCFNPRYYSRENKYYVLELGAILHSLRLNQDFANGSRLVS